MSHDAAIGLVQGVLASGVNLRYLYVDTVGDSDRYQAKLAELFPSLQVVVEKKADATYPIVREAASAARSSSWLAGQLRGASRVPCAALRR